MMSRILSHVGSIVAKEVRAGVRSSIPRTTLQAQEGFATAAAVSHLKRLVWEIPKLSRLHQARSNILSHLRASKGS